MKLVKLAQFQDLLALSDKALMYLLRENRLKLSFDPAQGILVNIEDLDMKDLVEAIASLKRDLLRDNSELIAERLASIVGNKLERLVEEALAISTSQSG